MSSLFYNVQHSPIGAFASFTLGFRGAKGGLGIQQGRPADEPVYIGLESVDDPNRFEALPFFDRDGNDESTRYVDEDSAAEPEQDDHHLSAPPGVSIDFFDEKAIERELTMARDTWTAGDLTFRVISPRAPLPDPEATSPDHDALKLATCPAVIVEIEVDNTRCDRARRMFFGFSGNDPYSALRQVDDPAHADLRGLAQTSLKGIFSDQPEVITGQAFALEAVLRSVNPGNRRFTLGPVGAALADTPAGQKATYRFAVAFYVDGVVTSGQDATYFYSRYFDRLESVARYALEHAADYRQHADRADEHLAKATHLNDDQRWQLAHAVHSYYGSTEFLDLGRAAALSPADRTPCWVVNEGEYRMMNTFDLTVDMLFYELQQHPWTVRNVLDRFIDRYAYHDTLHVPGGENIHPGGISFTHDQGITNHFTPVGMSSYELADLHGCFSHMSCEQLTNFVCCVGVYLEHTQDTDWLTRHTGLLEDCLVSLCNRDHPDPAQRNGIMGLDSSRTGSGSEITTYDSLDTSLGQARNNVYLAVKSWASYLLLEHLLTTAKRPQAAQAARAQAQRTADTLVSSADAQGRLPAVLFEGHDAPIIPAIEGIVFPYLAGRRDALDPNGPYAALVAVLGKHIDAALQPGVCLFDDGGWKLSSTSINSWLSKIYLCQYVYREILGKTWNDAGHASDRAHVVWLQHPRLSYWAWSDQMHSGEARGSRYYPRGVTAALWLTESSATTI